MAGHFTVHADGSPVVSADPETNWDNDAVQFPRLIAELKAAGYFDRDSRRLERALCASMNLHPPDLAELVDRATEVWEDIKETVTHKKE